jgi:hypothetical protein
VILYHRTNRESAESILYDGFKDGVGTYLTDRVWRGVWLSNIPLDENEGARGEVLLAVHLQIPARELREQYEWKEQGKGYREFLIPAEVLNRHVKKIDVAEGVVRYIGKITRRINENTPIRRTLGMAPKRTGD